MQIVQIVSERFFVLAIALDQPSRTIIPGTVTTFIHLRLKIISKRLDLKIPKLLSEQVTLQISKFQIYEFVSLTKIHEIHVTARQSTYNHHRLIQFPFTHIPERDGRLALNTPATKSRFIMRITSANRATSHVPLTRSQTENSGYLGPSFPRRPTTAKWRDDWWSTRQNSPSQARFEKTKPFTFNRSERISRI